MQDLLVGGDARVRRKRAERHPLFVDEEWNCFGTCRCASLFMGEEGGLEGVLHAQATHGTVPRLLYLVTAVHPEVREASGGPPPVWTLLGHLRLVPDVDADADEEEGELRLDQHPGHLGSS